MIKGRVVPVRWIMALCAVRREARRHVVRVRRAGVVRHVATVAGVRRVGVVPVVALVATHSSVCVRKRIDRMVIAAR